jgi:drug/metabolite transporter superfamily protein YnfA
MDSVAVIFIGALILALYFLPSIVAGGRNHASSGGIFVINLFLGWTLLGWVGALAWAASRK